VFLVNKDAVHDRFSWQRTRAGEVLAEPFALRRLARLSGGENRKAGQNGRLLVNSEDAESIEQPEMVPRARGSIKTSALRDQGGDVERRGLFVWSLVGQRKTFSCAESKIAACRS
jgi:hypothetical protein